MDYVKILKRAWEITWRYRALWVFGIILALVTAGGGAGQGGGGYESNGEGWPENGRFEWPEIPQEVVNWLIVAGVALVCLILILAIAGTIARYVAETALIRMVDKYEETGERRSVREGFRMGWSRTAFRLFLVNFLIGLPLAIVLFFVFGVALGVLLLSAIVIMERSTFLGVVGIVAGIGLFFLFIFLAIVLGTVVSLLRQFFWRTCALEELGVLDSIREGFDFVRRHLKDVIVMGLIMIGIQIGWVIANIAAAIVFFPVILLLIIFAAILGGIPALVVGVIASLFWEGAVPYILAALIGIPIFALMVGVPWLFLNGVMEVFKSSTWTLTYRELRALDELVVEDHMLEGEIGSERMSTLDDGSEGDTTSEGEQTIPEGEI